MIRVLVLIGVVGCIVAWPGPLGLLIGLPALALLLPRVRPVTRGAAACGLLIFGGIMGAPMCSRTTQHSFSSYCRSNFKQLGLALYLYRDSNKGRYPPYDGARFLVHLYRAGTTLDPDLFLCPSSADDNGRGALLLKTPIAPEACSYAGRRNRTQSKYPGIFTPRGAGETAIASDDDEGSGQRYNHGDEVIILFLDGHVEAFPITDPKLGVMGRSGLLGPLAN